MTSKQKILNERQDFWRLQNVFPNLNVIPELLRRKSLQFN